MRPINSILVPVDFSEISANAFRYALRLPDNLDASIDLLHVAPTDDGSLLSMTLSAQQVEIREGKLVDFFTKGVTAVSGSLEHVPAVRSYVKKGNIRATLQQHVQEAATDLIIMGTHEDPTDLEELFGTHTSQLVSNLPCPVLVIPQGFAFRPLQSICFATDLTHLDAFQAGHLLRRLRVFQPRLDFVHVRTETTEKTNFNMNLLREVFDRPGNELDTRFHTLESANVAEEIFEYATSVAADLVVMHRPHHNWLSRLFGRSHTRGAVMEATVPLLVLPQEKEPARELKKSFSNQDS